METKERSQQSESPFRELSYDANEAIFLSELAENQIPRYIEVNDVACRRLGYTRDELLTMTPLEIYSEGAAAEVRRSFS